MKKLIINEIGNWEGWTEVRKTELAAGGDTLDIGEKMVFENDEFRIWSIHLQPGKRLPFHKHMNRYYWTALSDGHSRSHYQDGSIVEVEYQSGDTSYFKGLSAENYFIHDLENIGSSVLIFSTVEFFI